MGKFCVTYRAIFGNRKRDVAPAGCHDFMPHDQDRKVDMDVWSSWQIAVRGW